MAKGKEKDKEHKNCWNFFNCAKSVKKMCPACNKKIGQACWTVAYSFPLRREDAPHDCLACEWLNKKILD